jgi:hypothetical protein
MPQLLRNNAFLRPKKALPMMPRVPIFLLRPTTAALVLAALFVGIAAAPARAQALAPNQIERVLGNNGYRLMGPVVRHGRVYIASVLGQQDEELRLVVDARNGRVLQRYPGDPAMARQGNPYDSSPLANFFDHLFGHTEEAPPLSPPPKSDFLESPKPKTQLRRPKPEANPAVQPAATPTDNKAAPVTPAIATPSAPAAAAPPATAIAPAAPVNPTAASAPAPTPTAKTTAAPETAAATTGKPVTKATSQKLNDVPVAPLE